MNTQLRNVNHFKRIILRRRSKRWQWTVSLPTSSAISRMFTLSKLMVQTPIHPSPMWTRKNECQWVVILRNSKTSHPVCCVLVETIPSLENSCEVDLYFDLWTRFALLFSKICVRLWWLWEGIEAELSHGHWWIELWTVNWMSNCHYEQWWFVKRISELWTSLLTICSQLTEGKLSLFTSGNQWEIVVNKSEQCVWMCEQNMVWLGLCFQVVHARFVNQKWLACSRLFVRVNPLQ